MSAFFGYIFLRAGGVTTRGMRDLISAEEGDTGDCPVEEDCPPAPALSPASCWDLATARLDGGWCFLPVEGLSFGIRLFLSE